MRNYHHLNELTV